MRKGRTILASDATATRPKNVGTYFGVSLPVWVLVFLAAGLAVGLLFPRNSLAGAAYVSGTWFPKAVVTFAGPLIFGLLAAATAKLVLLHGRRARRLFGLIVALYLALGVASLIFVTVLIPFLTKLPFVVSDAGVMGPGEWLGQFARTFASFLATQPLIQSLLGAMLVGYLSAIVPSLRRIAGGLIRASDAILSLFSNLLWYYPIMIGCLAIGIPLKFGTKGMSAYGQTILWTALVTVAFSVIMVAFTLWTTQRTARQVFSYFAAVWPTGFGTGGSYETLAVNIVSAEHDLGLRREIAEVSIVFGTVLNKSCASMSMLLITISATRLLHIPISMTDIILLVPPMLMLGLVSPGIPGGAGFFMSPIVAILLHVRDADTFVATFVAMYAGLIPMLSTAGNTTNDGLIGALLNDRFANYLGLEESSAESTYLNRSSSHVAGTESLPGKLLAWILLLAGTWMLVSPQALLGLNQLKWMHDYAFAGEVPLGMLILSVSLYLLGGRKKAESAAPQKTMAATNSVEELAKSASRTPHP
ncbi:MAG: dicarboxylate/amino acid:cation symporter [Acidobacteriia bacterium]|nr:dicarboxylate/amino acid:cation symporter [Terriglobia bacterium]